MNETLTCPECEREEDRCICEETCDQCDQRIEECECEDE